MKPADFVYLLANFRQRTSRQRHGSVLLAFAVVDGEEHGIEVEAVNAKVDALVQAQAATVQEQDHDAVGWLKESEDGVNFGTGKNNWNVAVAFGANDTVDFTKFPMQNMAEEEQQGVKGLVLRGGGGPVLHGQRGEEAADFLVADLGGGSAADKSLESCDPKPVSSQGFHRVVAQFDSSFEVTVFVLPADGVRSLLASRGRVEPDRESAPCGSGRGLGAESSR